MIYIYKWDGDEEGWIYYCRAATPDLATVLVKALDRYDGGTFLALTAREHQMTMYLSFTDILLERRELQPLSRTYGAPLNYVASNLEQIDQALRLARKERRLTQRAFGKLIGYKQSHVSCVEVNLNAPSLVYLLKAVEVLQLHIELMPAEEVQSAPEAVPEPDPGRG